MAALFRSHRAFALKKNKTPFIGSARMNNTVFFVRAIIHGNLYSLAVRHNGGREFLCETMGSRRLRWMLCAQFARIDSRGLLQNLLAAFFGANLAISDFCVFYFVHCGNGHTISLELANSWAIQRKTTNEYRQLLQF